MLKIKTIFLSILIIIFISSVILAEGNSTAGIKILFSTNEDYDTLMYGTDEGLKEVEEDFKLIKELGLSHLRISFSWINYEPEKGRFVKLDWLRKFVDLAKEYEITLMPYLCYAPEWAADRGNWNDPPKDYQYWYDYVYKLVSEFKDDIKYWELWNEEDAEMWFSGSRMEYGQLLSTGAKAVREANPEARVIMGGLTWPNNEWVQYLVDNYSSSFDIVPIHSYAESWSNQQVEEYLTPWGTKFDYISSALDVKGKGQPIWINEIGYPTTDNRTQEDQAYFIRRAIATLMATEKISLISWYEIKDLKRKNPLGVIGDSYNYYLGLTDSERNKKIGFYTYKNIISIFNEQKLTYLPNQFKYTLEGTYSPGLKIYLHPFKREADNKTFVFIWLYGPDQEIDVTITTPDDIRSIHEYSLTGEKIVYSNYHLNTINSINLKQDQARLFEIELM